MERIIKDPQEARTFLQSLGVSFAEDGKPTFPPEAAEDPTQEMTVKAIDAAESICRDDQPMAQAFGPIGAIVVICRKPKAKEGRTVKGQFSGNRRPPNLVSQFTAILGPLIHLLQRGEGGRLVRVVATYDPTDAEGAGSPDDAIVVHDPDEREIKGRKFGFNYFGDIPNLAGQRILFVVDHQGIGLDAAERIAKVVLGVGIQGSAMALTAEEEQEMAGLPADERTEFKHECAVRKRSILTAGFLSLVTTASSAAIAEQSFFRLDFRPRQYTICDNSPPEKKTEK